ncbi:MAG: hypothetical protein AAGI48_15105 [Verrucomicrobiota bacterium]
MKQKVIELAPKSGLKSKLGLLAVSALLAGSQAAQAAYSVVTYNDTDGTVAFTPENLTTPIIAGVVAAVGAGAVLFVIAKGVRWVMGMVARGR